jgi:hypothetical protein
MTQGERLEELDENMKDVCRFMAMEDVSDGYKVKELTCRYEKRRGFFEALSFRLDTNE